MKDMIEIPSAAEDTGHIVDKLIKDSARSGFRKMDISDKPIPLRPAAAISASEEDNEFWDNFPV